MFVFSNIIYKEKCGVKKRQLNSSKLLKKNFEEHNIFEEYKERCCGENFC